MSFDLLFALPQHLIWDVLGNWVGLKGIIRLDSAYAGKDNREAYLSTLKSKEFVVADNDLYSDDFGKYLVKWCLKRGIKFSAFAFGFQTCTEVTHAMMRNFFKMNGPTLKSFVMHSHISYDDKVWLKGLADSCVSLEVLEIEKDCAGINNLDKSLYSILRKHCTTLQKLDISCSDFDAKLPISCTFPVLREFHLRDPGHQQGLYEFLGHCPVLQRFTISTAYCASDVSFLTTLNAHCPHLNSINLLDIDSETIPEIIKICPRGPALHLHFDPYMGVEDGDIISAITGLSNIQSLTFRHSTVTDEVLGAVKKHCADSLRKLSINISFTFTFKGLLALLKACKNLKILYLNLCSELNSAQLCEIVQACPELTSLTLLFYPVDDAVLSAIAKHLPKLTHLNIEAEDPDDHIYKNRKELAKHRYTLSGLRTVMSECPKLANLCLGAPYKKVIIKKVQTQLTTQYPRLRISGPEVSGGWFMDGSDEVM